MPSNTNGACEIGKRIAELRKKTGLTQEELAKCLAVKRETVNQWENGVRQIKGPDIADLADALDTTCDYILRGIAAENVDIHRAIGLSDDSIKILKGAESASGYEDAADPNKIRIGILDLLIKDSDFFMSLIDDIYMCYEKYRDFRHAEKRHKELKASTKGFSVLPGAEGEFQQEISVGEAFNLKTDTQEKYEVAVFKANRKFGVVLENLISTQFGKNEPKEN